MPDGDRFERRLREKGWRTVYRLGCSGASVEAVAGRVLRAAAHFLRGTQTDCVSVIHEKLLGCLQHCEAPLFRELVSRQAFEQLSRGVEDVTRAEGYSEISRLAAKAALRTFKEIESRRRSADEQNVKKLFTRNLVWGLAERRCLSATREEIIQKTERSTLEQQDWEANLRESILDPCSQLADTLLSEARSRAIRAPQRLFKPAPVTLQTLHELLEVVSESR